MPPPSCRRPAATLHLRAGPAMTSPLPLTASNHVLRVPASVSSLRRSRSSSLPRALRHTVRLAPTWIDRMAWSVDEPVLVCRRIANGEDATTAAAAASPVVRLACSVCRVSCADPTGASHWSSVDVSCAEDSTISFQCELDDAAWTSRADTTLIEQPEEEQRDREARRVAREREALALAAPPPPPPATPVKKSKPQIMQLPSAASLAQSPARVMPSLQSTLAASARLLLRVDPLTRPEQQVGDDEDDAVYIIGLRSKSISPTATRVVLQPIDPLPSLSPFAAPPSAEDLLALGHMAKRFLHRAFVCADALIDVRSLVAPRMQAWKYMRVKEMSPPGEVCEISRATQFLIDPIPPASAASSASPTRALQMAAESVAATSSQRLHPALAALHSLLLPPLLYPQAFEHLKIDTPKGLLLSGPPGVGKTYSVGTVCRDLGVDLFLLDGASVYGGGEGVAGAAEQLLRDKFREAQANEKPAVLFIDEIDVLCPHRTNDSAQMTNRLVAQLLSLMDGLENRGHLLIVGATNHPNSLDAALRRPGRFDRELRLDPPTVDQRLDLLRTYTKLMPIAKSDVNDTGDLLEQVATQTIGYVAADLAALVREAAQHALHSHQQRQKTRAAESTDAIVPAVTSLPPSITRDDFVAAQSLVPASSLRGNGALASKSTGSFDQIGGLDAVKLQLRQAIEWPLQHADTFRTLGLSPPRGILLYGPPGCAKTSLVRAVAASSHSSFLPLDTASLYSCYVGEAERILRALFTRARANRPCVLFLDEIDAMVHRRDLGGGGSSGGSDAHSLESRILSTLLNEMDGMVSSQGLLVVAATNRLDCLDEALLRPGRFDNIVYVPPPDAASRLDILRIHARDMIADPDAPDTVDQLKGLADELEYYTGADITNLCREAAMEAIRRNEEDKLSVSDLRRVAAASSPSLNADLLRQYAPRERQ